MRKNLFVTVTVLVMVAMCFSIPVYAGVSITEYPSVSCSFDSEKKDDGTTKTGIKEAKMYSKKRIYFDQQEGIGLEGKFEAKKQVVMLVDNSIGTKTTTVTKINPFDYCLFSGDEEEMFHLHGNSLDIKGKIHTNNKLQIDADKFKIENEGSSKNACEYVTEKGSSSTIPIPDEVFYKSPVVKMPPLEEQLKDSKITKFATHIIDGTTWNKDYIDSSNGQMKNQLNCGLKYEKNKFEVTGGGQFVIPDKTTYYFDGDFQVSNSFGIKFVGSGMLIVTGNIFLNGAGIETSKEKGKEAFVYSCNGDINIQPGKTDLIGSFYAPNGTIPILGGAVNIIGSVIAKKVTSTPHTIDVTYYAGEVKDIIKEILPSDTVFVSTKEAAKDLLSKIPKPADVAILHYNSTADDNDFTFYDVETEETELIDILNAIPASQTKERNLGDALRRAYFMLKNSKIPGNKYIVAFTAGVPNTWTEVGAGFKEIDGVAGQVKVADEKTDKSLEYVKKIADKIELEKIKLNFVNCDETKPENEESIKVALEKKEIIPAANPQATESYYTLANVGDINDTLETTFIEYQIKDGEKLPVKVSFSFTLPAGVKLVSTKLPSWVKVDPKNPQIISGTYDTKFVWNSKLKKFMAPDNDKLNTLSLDVKYVIPPGAKMPKGKDKKNTYVNPVKFTNNKVTYDVVGNLPDYPEWAPDTSKLSYSKDLEFNKLSTDVIYKLDIN